MNENPSRASWRRDIALYGLIPVLVAWQAQNWKVDFQTIMNSLLAALIGMKAKMSNGHPKKDGKE